MTTATRNNFGEWTCSDRVELEGSKFLRIETSKDSRRNLTTFASVMHDNGDGSVTHVLLQDFSKRVAISSPTRVMAKTVEQQHASVMARVDELIADALAHYAK